MVMKFFETVNIEIRIVPSIWKLRKKKKSSRTSVWTTGLSNKNGAVQRACHGIESKHPNHLQLHLMRAELSLGIIGLIRSKQSLMFKYGMFDVTPRSLQYDIRFYAMN